ncbi:hypothetical protein HK098_006028, partial [Nowakowskiella sp. JEL0407]
MHKDWILIWEFDTKKFVEAEKALPSPLILFEEGVIWDIAILNNLSPDTTEPPFIEFVALTSRDTAYFLVHYQYTFTDTSPSPEIARSEYPLSTPTFKLTPLSLQTKYFIASSKTELFLFHIATDSKIELVASAATVLSSGNITCIAPITRDVEPGRQRIYVAVESETRVGSDIVHFEICTTSETIFCGRTLFASEKVSILSIFEPPRSENIEKKFRVSKNSMNADLLVLSGEFGSEIVQFEYNNENVETRVEFQGLSLLLDFKLVKKSDIGLNTTSVNQSSDTPSEFFETENPDIYSDSILSDTEFEILRKIPQSDKIQDEKQLVTMNNEVMYLLSGSNSIVRVSDGVMVTKVARLDVKPVLDLFLVGWGGREFVLVSRVESTWVGEVQHMRFVETTIPTAIATNTSTIYCKIVSRFIVQVAESGLFVIGGQENPDKILAHYDTNPNKISLCASFENYFFVSYLDVLVCLEIVMRDNDDVSVNRVTEIKINDIPCAIAGYSYLNRTIIFIGTHSTTLQIHEIFQSTTRLLSQINIIEIPESIILYPRVLVIGTREGKILKYDIEFVGEGGDVKVEIEAGLSKRVANYPCRLVRFNGGIFDRLDSGRFDKDTEYLLMATDIPQIISVVGTKLYFWAMEFEEIFRAVTLHSNFFIVANASSLHLVSITPKKENLMSFFNLGGMPRRMIFDSATKTIIVSTSSKSGNKLEYASSEVLLIDPV